MPVATPKAQGSRKRTLANAVGDATAQALAREREIAMGELPLQPVRDDRKVVLAVRAQLIRQFVEEMQPRADVPGHHLARRPPTAIRSETRQQRRARKSGGKGISYNLLLEVLAAQGRKLVMTGDGDRRIPITNEMRAQMVRDLVSRNRPEDSRQSYTRHPGMVDSLTRSILRPDAEAFLREYLFQRIGGHHRDVSLKPLSARYRNWKRRNYPGRPIGWLTGELATAVQKRLIVRWGR